ncbi:anhydro-N-acetylmuramic acid kinase [Sphingobacterium griseoflavum]|uniref:Anhydro-N-acetylmuramic acid kinase n=1 Tax=Sphingobacterium griseoflavum TaxID=1474952 RepID=A0ABQ3HV39_9SPHI|nr:anhydro-N-acetylmuramic acid kinase [Sphingobacterium griseoflavum]GHE29535.1 anhydro-N-acetylmuramic acid kinase [Sphingobacterium griseoflavum]
MNTQIERLYQIGAKASRRIIGLMSGTSLDGLDIAVCKVSHSGSDSTLILEKFMTLPYDAIFRERVRAVFAKRQIDQQLLCGLHPYIGEVHATLINKALALWGIDASEIDLIASHGQTVYHAPARLLEEDASYPNSTLQIGDADHIAVRTGIITIGDFRQKHLAADGEGAPLAAYGDYLLFRSDTEHRFLLNIGGIANFTYLPPKCSKELAYATDLGPGNTLINQYMKAHFGKEMDEDAREAKKGDVNDSLLACLLEHVFFHESFPKTTGPELFNLAYLENAQRLSRTESLAPTSVLATLTMFSAVTIAEGLAKQASRLDSMAVYVSGGGIHNPLLMAYLATLMPQAKIASFQALGLDPDAKEACLFAMLANETVAGTASNVTNIKDSPAVCMGKISFPY